MQHAHVILDNDAPLAVVLGRGRVEVVLAQHLQQLRTELRQSIAGTKPEVEYTAGEEKMLAERLKLHYLHYHLVPVFT